MCAGSGFVLKLCERECVVLMRRREMCWGNAKKFVRKEGSSRLTKGRNLESEKIGKKEEREGLAKHN